VDLQLSYVHDPEAAARVAELLARARVRAALHPTGNGSPPLSTDEAADASMSDRLYGKVK
jgi:hypothetical protein